MPLLLKMMTEIGQNGMNEVKFMKEIYEAPEIDIIEFSTDDIICTSIVLAADDDGEWNSIW